MSPTTEHGRIGQHAGIVTNFREGQQFLVSGSGREKADGSHAAAEAALVNLHGALAAAADSSAELERMRAKLNRATSVVRIQLENRQAIASRMTDVNVILEMSEFVRRQILTQPSLAGLSRPDNLSLHLVR